MLRRFREFLQWRQGDCIVLAEANVLPQTDMDYFGKDGERMHMMFNFQVNQNLFYALAAADTRPLIKALKATKQRPATAQWGMFLRNHDELDLGRLQDKQRQRVFRAFGPEKNMQLYDRGIRRRLAPMLGGDRRRIELAYSLMFTLPGTPVIRYGDELGMGDDLTLPERNCARTTMQWSDEPHGGFTKSAKPHRAVIEKGPYGYPHINAAIQRRHPDSLLNWTERIIRMRKEVPEIGWGDFSVLNVRNSAVLALRYDWRNNSVLFLHNLHEEPREVLVDPGVSGEHGKLLVNLLSDVHSKADKFGKHRVVLEGYGYRWYRVGGLDYLLRRTEIDERTSTCPGRRKPALSLFQRKAATVLMRPSEQTDPGGGIIAARQFVRPTPVSSLSIKASGFTMLSANPLSSSFASDSSSSVVCNSSAAFFWPSSPANVRTLP